MEDDDPDLDDVLDAVLVGGREERVVTIVEYAAAWPARFEHERLRIADSLGPVARRIEHIGSTAVPGLAAKPIVDIMVTVDDPDEEPAYLPQLRRAGYELRVREPDHRMFRTPARDVHVHVWRAGSEEERRHLAFRDRLRANADDRAEYERTKRELAGRWPDMNYYARAKSPVIQAILLRADGCADG